MKKAFLFAAALAASFAHAEPPGNLAAPLGLELGKTRCARLTPGPNRVTTGKAQWAGGDAIEIRNLDRFNLPGLNRAIVNCDAQDTVALVSLTFDRSALQDVTGKLDARYESKRKTEANAENAYAEWAAANGSLELLYARDGKHFTVAYWARGAKAKYFAYSGTSAEQKPAAPATPAPKQPAPL